MKKHTLLSLLCLPAMFAVMIVIVSCSDDDKPKSIPIVTTAPVTEVTSTTAKGGGAITASGNDAITASGLVYSSANSTPTLNDSKTEATLTNDAFTIDLSGLSPGTTYYVRAYATNGVGTGYGEVVSFDTDNAAPTATNVIITGTAQVGETLTGSYTYSDAEGDAESGTTFQWYSSNTAGGAETAIAGATSESYVLQGADEFKFITWVVTPRAATGTIQGIEVKSAFTGPVATEPTTVTFTYNEQEVIYGILISPTTGRKWLDRNLGAPNTPTAVDDFANYGDAFQWGRSADGHQLTTRAASSSATKAVNGTTTTLSSTDNPGHNLFIIAATSPNDWRTPANDNLWQGVDGINNPCPSGWRIPTKAEWEAENLDNITIGFEKLKLTYGGARISVTGNYSSVGAVARYWSSTTSNASSVNVSDNLYMTASSTQFNSSERAIGLLCRCIKN